MENRGIKDLNDIINAAIYIPVINSGLNVKGKISNYSFVVSVVVLACTSYHKCVHVLFGLYPCIKEGRRFHQIVCTSFIFQ